MSNVFQPQMFEVRQVLGLETKKRERERVMRGDVEFLNDSGVLLEKDIN